MHYSIVVLSFSLLIHCLTLSPFQNNNLFMFYIYIILHIVMIHFWLFGCFICCCLYVLLCASFDRMQNTFCMFSIFCIYPHKTWEYSTEQFQTTDLQIRISTFSTHSDPAWKALSNTMGRQVDDVVLIPSFSSPSSNVGAYDTVLWLPYNASCSLLLQLGVGLVKCLSIWTHRLTL